MLFEYKLFLIVLGFQNTTLLFQVVGEQFYHYRLPKRIFTIFTLHIVKSGNLFDLEIYISYIDLIGLFNIFFVHIYIYNSMYLQKNITCSTHPFLFFPRPLPLRWVATKKNKSRFSVLFSPNQSGVNQLGGWAALSTHPTGLGNQGDLEGFFAKLIFIKQYKTQPQEKTKPWGKPATQLVFGFFRPRFSVFCVFRPWPYGPFLQASVAGNPLGRIALDLSGGSCFFDQPMERCHLEI